MLGQVVEDLESQAEECVLNSVSAVSYRRFLNVGTVWSECALERSGWWLCSQLKWDWEDI